MENILETLNTGQKACIALAGTTMMALTIGAFMPGLVPVKMFALLFMLSIPLFVLFTKNQDYEDRGGDL